MVNGNMWKIFILNRGLKPGDPLSTTLFNIVLDRVIKNTDIIPTTRMVYADDMVILAGNKEN